MLQSMREGAGKWLVFIIIGILILALTLWGISSYFLSSGGVSRSVATVNGVKISQDTLNSRYNRLRQSQPNLFSSADANASIKRTLLDQLVNQSLLAQVATQQGFVIGDNELNAFLTQIPAFQVDGQFSKMQFLATVNRLMYTPEEFMTEMRNNLLINQARNGIASSSFALPYEGQRFSQLMNETRDIAYIIIPSTHFLGTLKLTDKNINNYYQMHRSNYTIPEKVSISYVEISPKSIENSIKPTQADLKNYYELNISDYTTPARWHVAHILLNVPKNASAEQIKTLKEKLTKIRGELKGQSFSALAAKNSEDILTSKKGGELPWFTAGTLGPIFEKTVAELKQGAVSQVVQTRYGIELIKLLDVDKQKVEPFSQVSSRISAVYTNEQLTKIMADKNDDLANSTFENPNSLTDAAKQLSLKIKTTPLFTRTGTASGIAANPGIIVQAFSDDVLQQGNNSDVITLKDGTLVALRTLKHVPEAVKPLKSVSAEVKTALTKQMIEDAAFKMATSLFGQIKSSADAARLSNKNGFKWVTRDNLSRQSKNVDSQILIQGFNLPVSPSANKLHLQILPLNNGDYALVSALKANLNITSKLSSNQLSSATAQVANINGQAAYGAYTKMLKDNAKISINSSNL